MDSAGSRLHEAAVFAGPARIGKTESLADCRLACAVVCDPGDITVHLPSEPLAQDFSKRRIRRLYRQSPEVGRRLCCRPATTTTSELSSGATSATGSKITASAP
jgi:phage terminase large subunit GpA-like protein